MTVLWVFIWIIVGFGWIRLLSSLFYWVRDRKAWPTGENVKSLEELKNYFKRHPDTFSFATFDLNDVENGCYWNEGTPRPLASTVKVVVLAAYAKEVAAGELNPDKRISLSDLRKWYLPRLDGGAHSNAIRFMKAKNKVDSKGQISLRQVVDMMIRFSSNAATDFLLDLIGLDDVNSVNDDLARERHTPVYFIGGQMLLSAFAMFRFPHPQKAIRWIDSLSDEEKLRQTERMSKQFSKHLFKRGLWLIAITLVGIGGGLSGQALLFNRLFTHATVEDYSKIMAQVADGKLYSKNVSRIMRDHLEWVMDQFPSHQQSFQCLGMKGGSLPGIFTVSMYGQSKDAKAMAVSSLFVQSIPNQTWLSLNRNGLFHSFALRLISDREFRVEMKERDRLNG